MQKVCLDSAGVYGSHIGPPIKLQFWGILPHVEYFETLLGTDPEKHGADPEKQGSLLLCPPPTRGYSPTLFGPLFEALAAAAPKKCRKNGS